MCHQAIIEGDMRTHDCRHEYVYAHGEGYVAAKLHTQTVQALMKRHNVKRNDPCFCHSGKKFKTCCGRYRNAAELQELINERLEKLPRSVPDGNFNIGE